ncbi:heme utilization protein HutZ [Vibrio sinensis]|uniref:Heme utilization protein HutZ n=1 Tax=Vibrio sinensis TaxID=2302434 RepID=A0A3A6QNW7_9VIBR|nr:heme utilization protein HutZ [Vibrio sinensis]RJX69997.1 heme utilization protein HutZ [Vibrio sinensis]
MSLNSQPENQPDQTTQREEVRRERLQNRLEPEVREFRDSRKTLQLATISPEGAPNATYAPFAFDSHAYYILVSDIASHGRNLKTNRNVSIMMVEDESEAKQVYARKRLTFDTNAELVEKQSQAWHSGIAALQARFGEIIENLSQLGDFNLYRLTPESGRYVKGFGQAFEISGNDLLDFVHLTEGHVQAEKARRG